MDFGNAYKIQWREHFPEILNILGLVNVIRLFENPSLVLVQREMDFSSSRLSY